MIDVPPSKPNTIAAARREVDLLYRKVHRMAVDGFFGPEIEVSQVKFWLDDVVLKCTGCDFSLACLRLAAVGAAIPAVEEYAAACDWLAQLETKALQEVAA